MIRENNLGDLARVLDRLAPRDASTREAVANCLGFTWQRESTLPRQPIAPTTPTPAPSSNSTAEPSRNTPSPPREPDSDESDRQQVEIRPLRRVELGSSNPASVAPLASAIPFEVPPLPSLIEPRWIPSLLVAMLGVVVRHGDPDVERIAEWIAECRPLGELPRIPIRRLMHETDVLLDVGDAMTCHRGDIDQLASSLECTLGSLALLHYFEGDPRRLEYAHTSPSNLGMRSGPILIATNFGVPRGRYNAQAWREFVAHHRHRQIVALAPLQPKSVPLPVRKLLPVIPWDRSTSILHVPTRRG